ncbi:MAG: hypothetical protein ACP6IQ_02275 [Candidatus Njordarchaeia archaeon]
MSYVSITVNGVIKYSEGYTDITEIEGFGDTGTLTLPHKIFNNIKIRDIVLENGIWAPWGRINAVFDNKDGDIESDYTAVLSFKNINLKLYHPELSITPPVIRLGEQVVHNYDGVFRQQLGHDLIKINLRGVFLTEKCKLPDNIEVVLEPSDNYGRPFIFDRLSDYLSGVDNIDIAKVMVLESRVRWNIKQDTADLTVNMIAPPQRIS